MVSLRSKAPSWGWPGFSVNAPILTAMLVVPTVATRHSKERATFCSETPNVCFTTKSGHAVESGTEQ